jgi:hypothetical protein
MLMGARSSSFPVKGRSLMSDRMDVALSVLTSHKNHTPPTPADIASLQSWVEAKDRSADYDELACIVISGEMRRRKDERVMHAEDRRANA